MAPGAHGTNRTGRLFTGDHSGQWLIRALYKTGFSNIPVSISAKDGLALKNTFITSCTNCALPLNKPFSSELLNCSNYFIKELALISNVTLVICLGLIAFQTYCKINNLKKLKFYHFANYKMDNKKMIASYHPSRQNTNIKQLTWSMRIKIVENAKTLLSSNT